MNGIRRFLLAAMTVLLIGGWALGQDVRYNFDKTAKFSDYKTYKWVEIKGSDQVDPLVQGQIRDAIDAELATKGLTKTATDNADLFIGFQTAIGTEKQFNSYSTGWGAGPGWGRGWYGGMGSTMTTGTTSTIYVGQLVLDMYEAKKHDLVWRGTVTKTLDPKAKPEKRQKNLNKAMAKLLKNYPPSVNK